MLKIAHVTSFFDPEYYRANEYSLSLELKRLGNDITIITSDLHSLWGGAVGQRGKFKCGIDYYDGLLIKRVRSFGRISITPLIFNVLKILREEKYDVILIHEIFHFSSFCSAIIAKKLNIPLVLFQHDYSGGRRLLYKILFRFNYWIMGKFTLHQAHRVITLSKRSKEFLIHLGRKSSSIEVIPTGIDVNLFRSNVNKQINQTEKIVLFVGRLIKEKGIYLLLNTFKDIINKVHNVRLLIVGTGPDENSFKKLCIDLNIDSKVQFAGRVKSADMPKIYQDASFFVLPTLTAEPFGNVLLEAMASGKPVIGSNIGGMRDVIVDGTTGFKIEPGNSEQLREKMLLLLKNENLRFDMGRKARIRAEEKFAWSVIGKKVNSLLQEIC